MTKHQSNMIMADWLASAKQTANAQKKVWYAYKKSNFAICYETEPTDATYSICPDFEALMADLHLI